MASKKPVTEGDLLTFLEEGQLQFPPLEFVAAQTQATSAAWDRQTRLDALLTLRWRDRSYRFGVETRRLWTPKAVSEAVDAVRRNVGRAELYPLILVPYLADERLLLLEAQGVSGIDLCGNGVVVVPGELLVLRTGFPNRFRWEGTIKNVYRKNSSVVARAFLLVPEFGSVKEALEEIRTRGGEVTLATVSKVCTSLEAGLVIERGRGEPPAARRLRLLQPEKLLDLLAENYSSPNVSRTLLGKSGLQPEQLRNRLAGWEKETGEKVVLTGASSVEAYAVMAREPVQSLYCTDIDGAVRSLGGDLRETDRFANLALLETRDDFVYFDRRPGLVASPIQTYLELAAGEKRERETAEQVRGLILRPLAQAARME
ncbi:MAG: hypothetical protein WD278_18965 [Pirellulales bacterium]